MKIFICLSLLAAAASASLIGGSAPLTKEDEASPSFIMSLKEATKSFNMRANAMYHHALFSYSEATKKVVAGVLYEFDATLAQTVCRNAEENHLKSLRECPLSGPDAPAQICHFKVIWRAWSQPRYEVLGDGPTCKPVAHLEKDDIQHKVILGHDDHDIGHRGQFEEFKMFYGKNYASETEEFKRFGIFSENMKKAYAYQLLDHGSARYGATEFADMTEEEFRASYLTPEWDTNERPPFAEDLDVSDIPSDFDWRTKGAVTEVKNQGSCGSCWAFSTTGNIEGQWFLAKKKLVDLSEQELVDCDKVDLGCGGGLPSQAYKEIMRIGGLESETAYPYKGRNMKCEFDKSKVVAYVNSSLSISKDEKVIAAWLVKNGPISIGINANAMQFYMGGVAHPWKIFCNPKKLDHGVLIVGYGMKGTEPYWIVKNSWGKLWGEKGYYLVYRGDGTCGLNTMCTSAIVK